MKRIIAVCAMVFIVVPACVGAYLFVSEPANQSSAVTTPVSSIVSSSARNAQASSLNTLLDVTGAKGEIESGLRSNAGVIASQLGVSEADVNSTIDSLSISDWQVASLPDGAVAAHTVPVDYNGTQAEVTLYDDSSYVTVSAYGQDVTLSVPESAQSSLRYLAYVG